MSKELLDRVNKINLKRKMLRSTEISMTLTGYELECLKYALERQIKEGKDDNISE